MESIDKYQEWKFWPVILIAFLYPVNNGLIGLAIPLYYFQEGLNLNFIGIIAAGTAITYSFSPILLNKLSDRIGRKRCLMLGVIGTTLAQLIFYITLEPIPFFISRLAEGLLMGMYWTNLQSSISDNSLHRIRRMTSRYNTSWNAGLFTGLLIGAIFLFFIDDVTLIFYFAPIFMFVDVFIVILFFQESKKVSLEEANNFQVNNSLQKEGKDLELTRFNIPILIPILLLIVFCFSKGTVNFLYPLKSEIIGFETFTVYFLTFLCIGAQLVGTSVASYFSIKNLKRIPLIAFGAIAFIMMAYGINTEFWVFLLLYISLGFFSGLLYGFALRMFITLNMQHKNSKYTSICESIIGSMFFVAPIITGYIAVVDIDLGFYVISILSLIVLVIGLSYIRKLKENN